MSQLPVSLPHVGPGFVALRGGRLYLRMAGQFGRPVLAGIEAMGLLPARSGTVKQGAAGNPDSPLLPNQANIVWLNRT
jgi:hypothetical protein